MVLENFIQDLETITMREASIAASKKQTEPVPKKFKKLGWDVICITRPPKTRIIMKAKNESKNKISNYTNSLTVVYNEEKNFVELRCVDDAFSFTFNGKVSFEYWGPKALVETVDYSPVQNEVYKILEKYIPQLNKLPKEMKDIIKNSKIEGNGLYKDKPNLNNVFNTFKTKYADKKHIKASKKVPFYDGGKKLRQIVGYLR